MELKDTNHQETDKNIDEAYTTCPDCGKPIFFDNDGGNGFCKDCSSNK